MFNLLKKGRKSYDKKRGFREKETICEKTMGTERNERRNLKKNVRWKRTGLY